MTPPQLGTMRPNRRPPARGTCQGNQWLPRRFHAACQGAETFSAFESPVFAGLRKATSGRVQLGQVAIYCRVSTEDQYCSRQERDLRAFAKRAGHEIVAVLKETASNQRKH